MDPKELGRDIKHVMRSTPKCSEGQLDRDRYRRYGYENAKGKYDAVYTNTEDDIRRRDDRLIVDKERVDKPQRVGFVKMEDRPEEELSKQ